MASIGLLVSVRDNGGEPVAAATGITRNTLSKMLNQHGVSVRTENLDRLCAYFECRIEQLVEYVPD